MNEYSIVHLATRSAFTDWWTLLRAQLERARPTFPKNLRGVIQFEGRVTQNRADFRFVRLDGPRTLACDGVSSSPSVWVIAHEKDLSRFIAGGGLPRGALQAIGDDLILRRFFAVLDTAPKQERLLSLRAERKAQ